MSNPAAAMYVTSTGAAAATAWPPTAARSPQSDPAAPRTAPTLVRAKTLRHHEEHGHDDREVEHAVDTLLRLPALLADSPQDGLREPRRRLRLRPRLQGHFNPPGRGERRRAPRTRFEVRPNGVVDREVSGGDRLDELQRVAASHVSSNSLKRFLARYKCVFTVPSGMSIASASASYCTPSR